jgi:dTMP kinase
MVTDFHGAQMISGLEISYASPMGLTIRNELVPRIGSWFLLNQPILRHLTAVACKCHSVSGSDETFLLSFQNSSAIGSGMAGLFITFEGSEACGKSTQVKRLERKLQEMGKKAIVVHEPGSTDIGLAIRHILLHMKENRAMCPKTELLLFAASRAQLVREVIDPALASGAVVVSDRFCDSTTVYQGGARNLDPEFVAHLNQFVVDGYRPDRTFVLDLDVEVASRRRTRRVRPVGGGDRIEELPQEFFMLVRQGYHDLAAKEPDRVKLIDAAPSADEVEVAIWKQLDGLLD